MLLKTACIQLNSGPDMEGNIARIEALVAKAAQQGARFIALPENAFHMDRPDKPRPIFEHDDHPGLKACAHLARAYACTLLAGTAAIKIDKSGKTVNRAVVYDSTGKEIAHYDKIHLFDVDVGDGQTYRESERIKSGERAVIAEMVPGALCLVPSKGNKQGTKHKTQGTKLGLTVCYDLRFPQLYRTLAQKGADILTVPAAFTKVTGEAHWHVLLRARAIENGCYVVAPAQWGKHPGGRLTYGHSLIIDPWGKIIAELKTGEGVITADLDLSMVAETRRKIPSLRHDRKFK